MENQSIEAIIEAVLFASGDAISIQRLAEITETNQNELFEVLDNLIDKYNFEKRGIKILKLGDKYQMSTRGEYAEYIQKIVEPKKKNPLSKATLEVLSIIAYKQPVTRSTIEHIRGVNSDNSVQRLLELELIEEVGKLDAPGKPALLGTTDEFLRIFALSGLSDLPPLEDYIVDELSDMNNLVNTEK